MRRNRGSGMRVWHRWFGFPTAFLFISIALTGVGLQIEQMAAPPEPGHGPMAPPSKSTLPADATLAAMVVRVAQSARQHDPGLKPQRIELAFTNSNTRGTVGAIAPFGPHITIDATTGSVIPEAHRGFDLHLFLLNLHAGFEFGLIGHVLSLAAGLALLTLCLTGLKVYFDLFIRRVKLQKRNPFWR